MQDLIGEPFRLVLSAENTSFHGMGREDIDVRCLGRGRPFVLEVKHPRVRRTDLEEVMKVVNSNGADKIEISDLRWTNRSEVSRVKETEQRSPTQSVSPSRSSPRNRSSLNQFPNYLESLWNNKHRRESLTAERT